MAFTKNGTTEESKIHEGRGGVQGIGRGKKHFGTAKKE